MDHPHHQSQSCPQAPAPTATATAATPKPGSASTQAQQQPHHQGQRHSLLAAVVAAVSQPGTEAGERGDDFEAMNYQTGYEEPSSASSTTAAVSASEQTGVVGSQPSAAQQVAVDGHISVVKHKRPYGVGCSVAKRAKLEHEQTSENVMSDVESEAEIRLSTKTTDHITMSQLPSPAPSPAPSSLPLSPAPAGEPRRTAYRRMRSKSLPDISLLSLHTSAIAELSGRKCSSRNHHYHHHRHHHHHHHRSSKLSSPSASGPSNVPPVNLQGLRELDLQEIFKNPQLRHDIVFDPQLQFRPNLDGERGRRKKVLADKYWDSVIAECDVLSAAYNSRQEPQIEHTSKLVGILSSLREILLSLLPARDRPQIEEVLDLELQVQQLRHAAFDFVKLANWLAGVFKSHCAPMRDAWVDQMLACITSGVATRDSSKLVDGLRMIFTILEAMKLDVANHQIRTLRPLLVETAVEFEQDYFAQRVQRRKVDVKPAVEWFTQAYKDATSTEPKASYIDGFVSALVSLFSSPSPQQQTKDEFPVTFAFDVSRLRSLKSDVAQITCLQQCLTLYRQLVASCQPGACPTQRDLDALKSELLVLVADDDAPTPSSSLSSPLVPSTITAATTTTAADMAMSVANNERWPANSTAIALQIARKVKERFPNRGPGLNAIADLAQKWLSAHLNSGSSNVYKLVEGRILGDLERRVKACFNGAGVAATAADWKPGAAQIKQEGWSQASKDVARELGILAGRICLLGDFHWSVFAGYYIAGVTSKV
ncbi:T-complex protein 11-domain-containing protein [Lipomyces kononenkoae]|uniref:T-complex protein 11-domain-containing protein n=1 Tax=Lipomyces kononenkoae TaxID=34357 RepID=A0ACC3T8H6_LIPKO